MYYEKPVHKNEVWYYLRSNDYNGHANFFFKIKKHQGRTTFLDFVHNYTIYDKEVDSLEKTGIEFDAKNIINLKQIIEFFEYHTSATRRYFLGIHIDDLVIDNRNEFDTFLKELDSIKFKNQYMLFGESINDICNAIINKFNCKVFCIDYNISDYLNIIYRLLRENHITAFLSNSFEDYLLTKVDIIKNCSFTDNKFLDLMVNECSFYKEGSRVVIEKPGKICENATPIRLSKNEKNIRSLRQRIEDSLLVDYLYTGEE